MTTATAPRSAAAELRKLERKRDATHAKAREAKAKLTAWDDETQALRYRLDAHLTAHPEQAEGTQRIPRPKTEAAKLNATIKDRLRSENPHRADYEAALAVFHAADEKATEYRATRFEDRLAELEPDAAAAISAIRDGWGQVLRGCNQYAAHRQQVLAVILTTPRLNGQAIADDGRVGELAKLAREVIEGEIATPDLTFNARLKAADHG